MQAAVWTRYGPPEVLEVTEVAKPAPGPREVLVAVRAANVFPGDCELRRFDIHPLFWLPLRIGIGILRPRVKILGQEYAGIVESVGSEVTRFKPGDEVFAPTGLGGAYAEYCCAKESLLAHKPVGLTFEEAATLSVGGLNAMDFLRVGQVRPGQRLLMYGAAGCIGTLLVQLARDKGVHVVAVDHTDKLAALTSLGVDEVIDYTTSDFTEREAAYDIVVDGVGKSDYRRTLDAIVPGGYYVMGNAPLSSMVRRFIPMMSRGRRPRIALAGYRLEDLERLAQLATEGRLKPVIDKTYPLSEVVAAHRYVESGKKIGNVVLTMGER